MFQTDAGRTARTRPLSAAAWPLVIERQRLPRLGLSTLNSMAFGLAVYASPGSLPHHDARLASSCWSSSTGRASHPQGSDERFQSCRLHLILLSQASWRNRCNRCEFLRGRIDSGENHRTQLEASKKLSTAFKRLSPNSVSSAFLRCAVRLKGFRPTNQTPTLGSLPWLLLLAGTNYVHLRI